MTKNNNTESGLVKYLPKTVGKNGYKYALVTNTSSKAVWEQRSGGGVVAYEVGYRKFRPPHPRFEGELAYTEIEAFWGNEDFGRIAWTYPDKETALECYDNLEDK